MTSPNHTDTRDLAGHCYERLRSLIVSGRMAPGARIIESELAERLGFSRTPIRAALQRLQQEGYVQAIQGGKHARLLVSPLTESDARELLGIVGAVEGLAAAWVARLDQSERREVVADLRAYNAELERLLRESSLDPEDLLRVHVLFHHRPLSGLSAPRLRALHAGIKPQAERYRRIYVSSAVEGLGFHDEVQEHETIIDAIDRGDPTAAQLAMQSNWERAAERLSRIIARSGDRGAW